MKLLSLHRYQFRNAIEQCDRDFRQFNGIFGPNGRGKTNLLEAIYYLTHLKSWRSAHKKDLILEGSEAARIAAAFESEGRAHELVIKLFPAKREVILDDKPIRSWRSYKTPFIAILFSPEDSYLWRASPERRRAALDQMIFHGEHDYLTLVWRYGAIVRHKNALLRAGNFSADQLDTWNTQLMDSGSQIIKRRLDFLRTILPLVQQIYSRIVTGQGAREQIGIDIRFLGETLDLDTPLSVIREKFSIQLAQKERLEGQGLSLVGPHRDDWGLRLDGQGVAATASQGEHRSLIVALKLSELSLLKQHYGEAPLFLVDDLTSELDAKRRQFLMQTLLETGCQTFLTSTEVGPFQEWMPTDAKIIVL